MSDRRVFLLAYSISVDIIYRRNLGSYPCSKARWRAGARVVLHAKPHVVQHGFPRKHRFRVLLKHDHHFGTRARDRLAIETHRSGGRLRQPRHDVQQRRFAAARRADQGDEFALPDRKADVPKRRAAVRGESLFEAIDQKGISHRRSSSLRFWWEKQSLQVSQSLCRCDLLS